MTRVAILGFGVVGSGVADLITQNCAEVMKVELVAWNINFRVIITMSFKEYLI